MAVRIAFAVFTAIVLASCARTPDDQRIREHIRSMQEAVEQRDPRAFLAYVTPDFSGNDNTVDRNGLGNVLRVEVLRNDNVTVVLGPFDVQMQGDRATVDLVATITGGQGGLIPERGAIYSIASGWRRDGKDWRCYAATWEQKL
ncbi:MAG: nuclear transport factor 2 family protein [Rudaea sp.]